jgi:hypothetical protein
MPTASAKTPTPPAHPNLATALAAFQSEIPAVTKGNTANIPGKDGKQGYSYKYADLVDVTDAALPVLTKNGLAFVSVPKRTENGSYELVGTLLHEAGETMEGALPLVGRSAQEIGSALTYMRRYLLCSMTGIVADEDDDGARAQAAQERTRQAPNPVEEFIRKARGSWNVVEHLRVLRGQIADANMGDVEVQGPDGPIPLGLLVNDRVVHLEQAADAAQKPPGAPNTPPEDTRTPGDSEAAEKAAAAARLRAAAQAMKESEDKPGRDGVHQ